MHISNEAALDGPTLYPWLLHRGGTSTRWPASKRCDQACLWPTDCATRTRISLTPWGNGT